MNKKVAVILSGCGVYDGSEIHESVITLLRLDQRGAKVQCFAPNVTQLHVVDHYSGDEMDETRNVLVESARIARGKIKDVRELHVGDFDALIMPGGFGVAKNLSDFALSGANCTIQPDVLNAAQAFVKADKPVGLMCISPVLAAQIFGKGVVCTIGNDHETAAALTQMGAVHNECEVEDIVEDASHKLISTPAYMLAQSISEAASGINKLVDRVLELAHAK
ncbi:isoprenoid biosynthesis protein [Pseudomonas taeanensis MS-3]|jgi:enhancing lycopene biosynthesis protein 2|uniref:Glyoxalase n=1 Tax=Pseudomonas taeanensis MS-3 TaxID=1395571 RepID=A0A0A1YQK7_9PSED|nr:isoprenoid biosynthesis glyoxalase ElbB [Pseudomonas taeanensis]KFX71164.1 isoprenoid biosynthesis protein [Pseudomonas taeanensis MS-3]